jgi:hypothetical protein
MEEREGEGLHGSVQEERHGKRTGARKGKGATNPWGTS